MGRWFNWWFYRKAIHPFSKKKNENSFFSLSIRYSPILHSNLPISLYLLVFGCCWYEELVGDILLGAVMAFFDFWKTLNITNTMKTTDIMLIIWVVWDILFLNLVCRLVCLYFWKTDNIAFGIFKILYI